MIHLHSKGRQSAVCCCGQTQTVLKISPLFWCLVLSCPLLSWPFLSAFTVSVHLSRTQIKLTTNPNSPTVYSFRRAVFNLCTTLSLFVVPVSAKPKEPGAAVVAPGRSSAQPSVWQGVRRWRRRSGTEVRGGRRGLLLYFLRLSEERDSKRHCQI